MNKTRDEQTAKIYARIGEYVVEFSQLVHWLKIMLASSIAKNSSQQPTVNDLLDELSDGALIRVVRRHLVAPEYRSTEDRKIIDEILGRIGSAEAERNQLLHSVWFVGWGNEQTTDWSKAARIKSTAKRTKIGASESHNESEESIAARVRNLSELRADAVRLVTIGLVPLPESAVPGKIARNFEREADGRYRVPQRSR